jgi:hypothetical protein
MTYTQTCAGRDPGETSLAGPELYNISTLKGLDVVL